MPRRPDRPDLIDPVEYFQLKVALAGEAPVDWDKRLLDIWPNRDSVASTHDWQVVEAKSSAVAEAAAPLTGLELTLVPGIAREDAEQAARSLRSVPHVLAVEIETHTWTIRPDAPCLRSDIAANRPGLFSGLLLAFYLYDPNDIGVALGKMFRNDDEYAGEVRNVIERLPAAGSISDVQGILRDVLRMGSETPKNIEVLADATWRIWQRENVGTG